MILRPTPDRIKRKKYMLLLRLRDPRNMSRAERYRRYCRVRCYYYVRQRYPQLPNDVLELIASYA